MPDWEQPDHYVFPLEFPHYRWAWEFLRRNPEYRKDWKEALASFASSKAEETSETPWTFSASRTREPDHERFYLKADSQKKWHLANGLLNPSTDAPRFLSFSVGYGAVSYFVEDAEVSPDPAGPRYPWAAFDITLPLKPQMASVLVTLKSEQMRLAIKPHRVKHHRKLWPLYLRLLDADLDRRTARQIADVLGEENDAYADEGRIWDQLQAARRMTSPEAYLSIFLSWSDYSR